MVSEGVLVGAIRFLEDLGVYDVALPFLLVFTITFAILEKTKIFGTEKVGDEDDVPKKNLNAMAAFVIAFLVVASTNLVAAISKAAANIVLLLILSVSFLMLIGSFTNPDEMKKGIFLEDKKWKNFFMILMFIGIVFIFLDAIPGSGDYCEGDDCTWLTVAWDFMKVNWDSSAIASIILLLVIAGFIGWISRTPAEKIPVTPGRTPI